MESLAEEKAAVEEMLSHPSVDLKMEFSHDLCNQFSLQFGKHLFESSQQFFSVLAGCQFLKQISYSMEGQATDTAEGNPDHPQLNSNGAEGSH